MAAQNASKEPPSFEIDDDVDEELDDGQLEVENLSSEHARFQIDGRKMNLKPGQKTRIPKEYCVKRPADPANPDNGNELPPVIEMLTGKRVKHVPKPAPKTAAAPAKARP